MLIWVICKVVKTTQEISMFTEKNYSNNLIYTHKIIYSKMISELDGNNLELFVVSEWLFIRELEKLS